MVRLIFLGALLALASTRPAYAYIDPGTASIVLQAVIGGIAVTSLFFRSTVAKVFRFLWPGKYKRSDEAPYRPAETIENKSGDG